MILSDLETIQTGASKVLEMYGDISSDKPIAFSPPKESLEKSLENLSESLTVSDELCEEEVNLEETKDSTENEGEEVLETNHPSTSFDTASSSDTSVFMSPEQLNITIPTEGLEEMNHLNITDEEKERLALESPMIPLARKKTESLSNKPFLETILNSLFCTENDYAALFALCLLYALVNNQVSYFKNILCNYFVQLF